MVEKITITEALAELKTLKARIVKKRENITRYFVRDGTKKDPLASSALGGSAQYVRQERQGVADLEKRIVSIRSAISKENSKVILTLKNVEMSVGEWLTWRREISEGQTAFLRSLISTLNAIRTPMRGQVPKKLTSKEEDAATDDVVVVSIPEEQVAKEAEDLEELLGSLDGKLSLLNATTVIEV